jgi:hypothetical protein
LTEAFTKKHPKTNIDIVVLALYELGGNLKYVETEHIAFTAFQIAPARFCWKYYKDQIHLEAVRISLRDATKTAHKCLVSGSIKSGWMLTPKGVTHSLSLQTDSSSNRPSSRAKSKDEARTQRERNRILSHPAVIKYLSGEHDQISVAESMSVFRLDDYSTVSGETQKIQRIKNTFIDDGEVLPILDFLSDIIFEKR